MLSYLIKEVDSRRIVERLVHTNNDPLDFIPSRPLRVARMFVDSPDILPDLWINPLQEEVVHGVQVVREDELRPREDPQLVARRVEVVPARQFVRRLVYPSAPHAQL